MPRRKKRGKSEVAAFLLPVSLERGRLKVSKAWTLALGGVCAPWWAW